MDPVLRRAAEAARGFLPADEGLALHDAALAAAAAVPGAPLLEVGTWCGRSAVFLGAAARQAGTVLFTVDHHRGSEEQQAGWAHHDADLVDPSSGRLDTLGWFRRTITEAGLEDVVVGVVGPSAVVARHWGAPLALLFVDGGHGEGPAAADYAGWARHVAVGGTLAVHDVFADPTDGGQAPHDHIYAPALASGTFVERRGSACGSLRLLTRVGSAAAAT